MNNTLRKRTHDLLNPDDHGSRLSNLVNITIITLILINVLAASFETVQGLYEAYQPIFIVIEILSITIFTLEYALRFWSAVESDKFKSRLDTLFRFDSIIDLLAIAPCYLSFIFNIDLGALIVLRLLRLLKLVRYFEPLAILGAVIKAEFRAFMAAMFVLTIFVFIAATGIYFFENEAQPEVFGNIPQSMWWAIVTLTTLGYGDVIPITAAGQVFASIITILSIGTVALPAGMLASRFSEELGKRKIEMKKQIAALEGDLSLKNKKQLEEFRTKLCLSEDDMQTLLALQQESQEACPLCGKDESHG